MRFVPLLLAVSLVLLAPSQADKKPEKTRSVSIKTVEGLQFHPVRLEVKSGERINLHVENHDPNDQPHNFVLIKPGTLAAVQAASMQVTPELMANGYVPDTSDVLLATGLLNPEEKEAITFTAPKKKGIYPYVCTFPGHALIMYGALYVDEKIRGNLAYDPNVPELARQRELEKLKVEMDVERPAFQRMFMPNAGPAAIAVALPEKQNYCWDAGACRLRYAWSGSFIDATGYYRGNGNRLAVLMGNEFWNSGGDEFTQGIQLGDSPVNEIEFLGYSVEQGLPVFEYLADEVPVRESLTSEEGGLKWSFQIEDPPGDVRVRAPEDERAVLTSEVGNREGDWWKIPRQNAADFTLRISKR